MNKRDVLEIRKQFSPENCAITRICGCYVDHEKNKVLETVDAFLSMAEEEAFKYYEIFKKTLSGSIGKNLINMEFPLESEKEGGSQKFLYDLKNSKLSDEMLLEEFYDKVIANYEYEKNYYIILIHGAYDIPGKTNDGIMMDDASDKVYEYLLCSICHVNLSKAGLSYDAIRNSISDRIRDWVVEEPTTGFLFPAFDDRDVNIHNALYYSKKPEDIQPYFVEQLLGTEAPLTAKTQKETFNAVVEELLREDCEIEVIKTIHENLNEMIEESKENPEPLELGKLEIKNLLENSGVKEDKLEKFEETFLETVGNNTTFVASNIANTRKFDIKTPDVEIKVKPERTDLIETKIIDNRKCIVIQVDDNVLVNGVYINMNNQDSE